MKHFCFNLTLRLAPAGGRESMLSLFMHRWSKLFIPTLREAPADAEVASHKFLLPRRLHSPARRRASTTTSFFGARSLNKIVAIVRQEMDKIGQEFYLPGVMPARAVGRKRPLDDDKGDNIYHLKDRKGADLCLWGMTHEEIMARERRAANCAATSSCPRVWYQIQTKFRDEPRPKWGLLRVRQTSP